MLSLTTVGTGTAFPEADRGPTCMLLRHDDRRIVVDLGSGALQKLCTHGVSPFEMDALLFTHAHLDHFADLVPLLFALHVPGYQRDTPLDIYASEPAFALLDRLRAAYGDWLNVPESNVAFHTLSEGDRREICGLQLDVHPVDHAESSIGYRFTTPGGTVVAIPGDSGPCEGLTELCRDADVAVVECSMPDIMPISGHMNPSTLATLIQSSVLKHLLVTHQYPAAIAMDAVGSLRGMVDVRITVPDDGETFEIDGP